MKRSSKPAKSPSKKELTGYIAGFVADELEQRFSGRKLSEINDHEVVEIITNLLHNMPSNDDWRWARRQAKKLDVTAAELLTMRWSKANALAVKRGLSWAIKPK